MTAATLSDKAIFASLKAHPGLRDPFASIIGAIENSEGNFKEADAVEERIVEEMRLLGEAMQGWAENQVEATDEKFVDKLRCIAKVKKAPLAYEIRRGRGLRAAIPVREKARSPVHAQRESRFSGLFRPTTARDRRLRRDSLSLWRAPSCANTTASRSENTIQRVTSAMPETCRSGKISLDFPEAPGRHKDIVAETDGSMIPIVEPDARQKDKRKGKTLSWREAKISLTRAKGSRMRIYDGAIEGGVEIAGRQLLGCAVRAGFGADSAFTRSGTERPGSWVRWERTSAHKAAI